jgi:BolA family transcriptional regulator, general stress-responsive regulator
MNRAERICAQLRSALHTDAVELIDDSHLHAGHAGARDGRGHFRVRVVSTDFEGLRTLQRHQLVYRSLGDLMQTDIHALGIVALTPAEVPTSD